MRGHRLIGLLGFLRLRIVEGGAAEALLVTCRDAANLCQARPSRPTEARRMTFPPLDVLTRLRK